MLDLPKVWGWLVSEKPHTHEHANRQNYQSEENPKPSNDACVHKPPNAQLSDRRRRAGWRVKGASKLQPRTERRSIVALQRMEAASLDSLSSHRNPTVAPIWCNQMKAKSASGRVNVVRSKPVNPRLGLGDGPTNKSVEH